jgi:hypothetical protein
VLRTRGRQKGRATAKAAAGMGSRVPVDTAIATMLGVTGALVGLPAGANGRITSTAFCRGRPATVRARPGSRRLVGTAGADVIVGGRRADVIDGRAGNDRICGRGGGDRLRGGRGDDRLSGQAGRDRLAGGRGNDLLSGGAGNDRLSGGSGKDLLIGGSGRDRMSGGPGNDRILAADRRRDLVDCGPGRDSVEADRFDRLRRCERVVRLGGRGRRLGRALDAYHYCRAQVSNASTSLYGLIVTDVSHRDTDDWDMVSDVGTLIHSFYFGKDPSYAGFSSESGLFRGCGMSFTVQFVADPFVPGIPAPPPGVRFTIDTSYPWGGSYTSSCTRSHPESTTCNGSPNGEDSTWWEVREAAAPRSKAPSPASR